MAEIIGPRPLSTSTRATNAHRVHSSCDRCRSRKTKCIDPIPGPCRYCARTGTTCTIAAPRRKRPYYHVTEEEYQLSMSILGHVFPDRELNLQSLRALSKAIKEGSLVLPTLNADNYFPVHESPEDDDGCSIAGTPVEWLDDLNEPLGSMMKDSKGVYRYVGAQSDIPFNAAIAHCTKPLQKPSIIPAATVGHYPPKEEVEEDTFYLPPKEELDSYVKKYRTEVHCMYWLYPEEQLLQRIEDTYSWYAPTIKHEPGGTPCKPLGSGERPSISWICSLYAICAIGADHGGRTDKSPSPGPPSLLTKKTSENYLALVKQLKPKVEDSADIDSIRALVISAIALENALSRVTAYLYVGTAVQIAYTLGLHRDQLPMSRTQEGREENRRIWWTLVTLDLEIGMRGGNPTHIDARYIKITTSIPHERLSMSFLGIHTPQKWLSTFVSLSNLKREVIQTIYTERDSNELIKYSKILDLLGQLQKWYGAMPANLKLDVLNQDWAETYRRPIIVLHLHYWSTLIILTRPFLLNLVLNRSKLARSTYGYQSLANVAVDAARRSVELFQRMIQDRTISSVTTFDSTTVLRCITIFMCSWALHHRPEDKQDANACVSIAKSMEQIGFARMITTETPIHMRNLGMDDTPRPKYSQESYVPDDPFAEMWDDYQLTSIQNQQTLDLEFDDSGALDSNTNILAFEYLNESTDVFRHSNHYSDFDLRR